jgi:phospholipase/carboxylesterase
MNADGFTLQHIAREPRSPADRPPLLVLLHGVRSNEQDLIGLASMLDARFYVVSAQAPIQMGPSAYGWYHVQFRQDGTFEIDDEEADRSREMVIRFVRELKERYPVDPDRVFLMGFSQGCIMSLGAALAEPKMVAGVVGMSGRLLPSTVKHMAAEDALRGLPLYVVHGTRDQVISIEYGREIRDRLSKLPVELTYREYDMGHNVTRESMDGISEWLTARLS